MISYQQKEQIIHLLKLYQCFGMQYINPLVLPQKNSTFLQKLPTDGNQLYEYIQHCNLCELSKGASKKYRLHNIYNKIYFVDLNCDFQDPTNLNMLKNSFENIIKLDFNQVYMTNIIKCNTINKNFTKESVSLCKEYFFQELAIGKPKVIFATLEACKYILNIEENGINIIGKSYQLNQSIVFPIFSTNFLIKNPSYNQEMQRIFQKIKGLIN